MKKIVASLCAVVAFVFAGSAVAGEPSLVFNPQVTLPSVKVFDDERQLDAGVSYRRGGRADWGYFFRATSFLNEKVGLGVDFSALGERDPEYSAGLNIFLRAPLEDLRLAPYLLMGAGYTFGGINDLYYQAGAGLDFRLTPNWGLFVEGTSQWVHEEDAALVGRVGLKFVF